MERAVNRCAKRSWPETMADWVMTPIATVCVPITLAIILAGIGAWRGWLWMKGEWERRAGSRHLIRLPSGWNSPLRTGDSRRVARLVEVVHLGREMSAIAIQTVAAIVQAVAAAAFLVGVVTQRRAALIDRLLQRWARTSSEPTPNELEGTPYSQRQKDFVNKQLEARGGFLSWRWRGK
jgi:hypothetical protein